MCSIGSGRAENKIVFGRCGCTDSAMPRFLVVIAPLSGSGSALHGKRCHVIIFYVVQALVAPETACLKDCHAHHEFFLLGRCSNPFDNLHLYTWTLKVVGLWLGIL